MSSNNNTNDAKKRRVDGGGISGGIPSAGSSGDQESREDMLMKMMHQQMAMMKGMQDEMKSMHKEMKSMQDSLKIMNSSMQNMQVRQSRMESSMQTMHNKQNCNTTKLRDIRGRFMKAETKQKYHEILLKNQKWEYSVPRPDAAFWNGITDDGLAEAEDFLVQMQKQTEIMRYGSGEEIRIDSGMVYHRKILPHWEEFANALEQYQYHLQISDYDGESSLTFNDIVLSTEVINLLSRALKSTYFHEFTCQNNELDQNGIKFALDYLQNNQLCKHFALHQNLLSMENINRLCQIVKDHPSIKILGLCGYKDEDMDGYTMLMQIMTAGRNTLEVVELSDNNINTGGDSFTFIPDFLAENPILESLDITDNELDDNDLILVASSLKHNTKLRSLRISGNDTTSVGWEALSKAVFDKTSLNSAADSNHTCMIDFPYQDKHVHVRKINGDEFSDHYYDPEYVRQKKIYMVLSQRNKNSSNVDHFDEDMPVELLPYMLLSIQKYAGYHIPNTDEENEATPPQDPADVKPLSIMFEILKRWDKSLAVFEALSSL